VKQFLSRTYSLAGLEPARLLTLPFTPQQGQSAENSEMNLAAFAPA
jgi:hypothetical protein